VWRHVKSHVLSSPGEDMNAVSLVSLSLVFRAKPKLGPGRNCRNLAKLVSPPVQNSETSETAETWRNCRNLAKLPKPGEIAETWRNFQNMYKEP